MACIAVPMIYLTFIPGVFFALASVGFGFFAYLRTRPRRVPTHFKSIPEKAGFSLAKTGLFLAVIGLTLNLFFGPTFAPSLSRSREAANRIKCGSNLLQIGQALQAYTQTHQGKLPPRFEALAETEPVDLRLFRCPNDETWRSGSSLDERSYILLPTTDTWSDDVRDIIAFEPLSHHRADGVTVLFGDGSVRFVHWEEVMDRLREAMATGD
jgi:hypothetical protein